MEGYTFPSAVIQKFKGDEDAHKDSRAGELLLKYTVALQSDNEKLRSIDKKLQIKCEDQNISLVAKKEDHIPYNRTSDTVDQ